MVYGAVHTSPFTINVNSATTCVSGGETGGWSEWVSDATWTMSETVPTESPVNDEFNPTFQRKVCNNEGKVYHRRVWFIGTGIKKKRHGPTVVRRWRPLVSCEIICCLFYYIIDCVLLCFCFIRACQSEAIQIWSCGAIQALQIVSPCVYRIWCERSVSVECILYKSFFFFFGLQELWKLFIAISLRLDKL